MDPDPGGPKTCESAGSGSPTLIKSLAEQAVHEELDDIAMITQSGTVGTVPYPTLTSADAY
jgi:hypothetical protein